MASFQGGRSRAPVRILAAAVGLLAGVALAGYAAWSSKPGHPVAPATNTNQTVLRQTMPATADRYLGVYEPDSPGSYTQVDQFAQVAGRQPNLVLYYSSWGQAFEASFANSAQAHGATVIIDLDPSVTTATATTGVPLSSIVNGSQDAYLDSFARSVLNFGHPVVLSFGHEMNGNWYSWGWTHAKPNQFVQAWRHVVKVFHKVGADNVTWLWTVSDVQPNDGPIKDYWPGAAYVNWVGVDAYYYDKTYTFDSVFSPTITAMHKFTHRPVLITETAVGPIAGSSKIPGLLAGVQHSGVLGLVWFDQAQSGSKFHQNWRLEGNAPASAAFKAGVAKYLR